MQFPAERTQFWSLVSTDRDSVGFRMNVSFSNIFIGLPFHQLGPSGPSWSSSRDVCLSVCLSDVPFHVVYFEAYFAPTLEIRSPWGKVLERKGLRFEKFCWKVV